MVVEEKKWDLLALRRSIPSHLYQSNTALSMYYAARSVVLITALGASYIYSLNQIDNLLIKVAISAVYWFLQGTVFWGVFTIGHDCGHRSFSSLQWVNNLVGTIYHGFILVPFYQWKMSHHHHHQNTGNIDKDEIFYPIREHDAKRMSWKGLGFMNNGFLGGLGWVTYLLGGYPGINYTRTFRPELIKGVKVDTDEILKVESAFHSHFNPYDPMWNNNLFLGFSSVITVLSVIASTVCFASTYGWARVVAVYYVPWFVFCCYLTVVTFLHHASEKTRWLDGSIWNYARGQLENTIDRTYGGFINNISHNIGTHVVHHLFPIIPHYNLVKANNALKAYTTAKGLPHHEVLDRLSGITEFAANAQRYSKNFVVAEDTLISSLDKGVIVHKNTPAAEEEIKAWQADVSRPGVGEVKKEEAPVVAAEEAPAKEQKVEKDAAASEESTEEEEEDAKVAPVSAPRQRKK